MRKPGIPADHFYTTILSCLHALLPLNSVLHLLYYSKSVVALSCIIALYNNYFMPLLDALYLLNVVIICVLNLRFVVHAYNPVLKFLVVIPPYVMPDSGPLG